jgi:GT2 family glycosyltransferase
VDGSVGVLLVSHDGSRWLPQVLDGLAGQTVTPDRVVAVDTGSRDSSVEVLCDRLGSASVHRADRGTSYPQAVRLGLEALGPAAGDDWVWLLHDDCAPAPDALERLLEARAPGGPEVLGPKIREWPSLRRLLEVGVTVTGTGRRETGLERGEHDQGQHDEPRDVLAVNTAGMLVRRQVLEQLGLDDALPVLHTDVDFGWRANRAGVRVRTVPAAVVFHAEASRNGIRTPDIGRGARRRADREAALFTVLANCAPQALPFVVVRLLLGTLLRAVGLLLVRAPGEAWAEVRAAVATVLHPARVLRARRSRRSTAVVAPREVRPLLAPAWLPYRNGLDELAGIGAAVVSEAGARAGGADGGLSWGRRLRHSPAGWLAVLLVLASIVAARELLGGGRLSGGALLPAPDSALDSWRTYLASTHDLATGSTATAPAYLVPLAVLGTLLLGSTSMAVDLVVLGAVPVAGLGAYRFLRRVAGSPALALGGAVSFAVLLATSGALAQGRIGTLAAAALTPWLAASAWGLAADSADRRRRAAWRTALWLALAAAFAPLAWILTAVAAVGLVLVGATRRLDLRQAGLVLLPLPVAAVLLLPWSALAWGDHGWSWTLLEAGLPASSLVGPMGGVDALGARASDTGSAPAWVAGAVALLAVAALLRKSTRTRVVLCWWIALVGIGAVRVLSEVSLEDPSTGGQAPVWSGLPLLVAHGAWLTAVVLAARGARGILSDRSFGWRQPLGVLLGVLALVLPVCGTAWWMWQGSDGPLQRTSTATVPAYMDAAAEQDRADGTLVLRGGPDQGITAEVRRGAPLTLGEEVLLPGGSDQGELLRTVGDLVTSPGGSTPDRLAALGVAHVFVPDPVDPALAAALDAVPTLGSASADSETARAWRLEEPTSLPAVATAGPAWVRPLLLAVQALAVVVVVVLAAPTRRRQP